MNSISVIGTGYVGLVSGTCLAEFGMDVTCMDVDKSKIDMLNTLKLPIYEPELEDLVEKNFKAGRLHFTCDIVEAVEHANAVFIAVGTPPQEDGSADMKHVLAAVRSVAEHMENYTVIVDKSTVPMGTGRLVEKVVRETLEQRGVDIPFDVVSNPEFLREGSAVKDFKHPDRIVIGCSSDRAREVMQSIYRVLYINNHPFIFTDIETAELIKYASNAFLATKIAYINEMSALCEASGANVQDVARAMGLDGRIGKYFLHAGPGYGGSCFPKDTKALLSISRDYGCESGIVRAVIEANAQQKLRMFNKISQAMGGVAGKTVAVLGLAFKPETDDMREASSVVIIREILKNGGNVRAFDPIAMENARSYVFNDDDIYYATNEYDAVKGADAVVIVTEWNQFRNLDLRKIRAAMNGRFFFDLRNIYERDYVEDFDYAYSGVGR
ncbi:MAG: UDP-glucose/GDP-mannose dehydrogenase family protein [Clostridia bacterium]|nr:UDP-glucose/GDP-mannose dehydrogenase family protein [Clostridia bacterium]MDR3643650.1 UDP-glucose/GDP-mannose dehydrogenase family protein [Clostridia bacterium]